MDVFLKMNQRLVEEQDYPHQKHGLPGSWNLEELSPSFDIGQDTTSVFDLIAIYFIEIRETSSFDDGMHFEQTGYRG